MKVFLTQFLLTIPAKILKPTKGGSLLLLVLDWSVGCCSEIQADKQLLGRD